MEICLQDNLKVNLKLTRKVLRRLIFLPMVTWLLLVRPTYLKLLERREKPSITFCIEKVPWTWTRSILNCNSSLIRKIKSSKLVRLKIKRTKLPMKPTGQSRLTMRFQRPLKMTRRQIWLRSSLLIATWPSSTTFFPSWPTRLPLSWIEGSRYWTRSFRKTFLRRRSSTLRLIKTWITCLKRWIRLSSLCLKWLRT